MHKGLIAAASVRTIGALLDQAEGSLKKAGIEQPALEAAWLLEYVLALSTLMQRVRRERRWRRQNGRACKR